MNKLKIALVSLLFLSLLVFDAHANGEVAQLPIAGITPESPFYFLDIFVESLREFFTFNKESKARLQITFAAERIAEIKVILETKGADAKGIEVAQARLQSNLAKAAEIVSEEKVKGRDVSNLAKNLKDEFSISKSVLTQSIKEQKKELKSREEELKKQMRTARRAGDDAQLEALAQEFGQVKTELELLELKEEDIDKIVEEKEDRLEEEMEDQQKAKEAIKEAIKEREEIINEAAEEGIELPGDAFAKVDSLIEQAKSVFDAGNYDEARLLAKQAENAIEQVDDVIDELEKQKELQEEVEEAIEEAEEEADDLLNEAAKEGVELPADVLGEFNTLLDQARSAFATGNYEEAKRLAKQAEESLDNAEETVKQILEEAEEEKEALEEKEKEEKKEKAVKEEKENRRDKEREKQEEEEAAPEE